MAETAALPESQMPTLSGLHWRTALSTSQVLTADEVKGLLCDLTYAGPQFRQHPLTPHVMGQENRKKLRRDSRVRY